MSQVIQQAVVTDVSSKSGTSKAGRAYTMWNITLEGFGRIGCGFDQPQCNVGDTITLQFDMKGEYKNLIKGTLAVASSAPVAQPVAAAPAPAAPAPAVAAPAVAKPTMQKDDYWKNKELKDAAKDERYQKVDVVRMTYSSARNDATAIITAALAEHVKAISWGKLAAKERLTHLENLVTEMTERLTINALNSPERIAQVIAEQESVAQAVDATVATDDWEE